MPQRPTMILFDVNETLSDLSPLAECFAEVGASPELAPLWFASVLRDGFALTAAGSQERFATIAREVLVALLPAASLDRSPEDAATYVLDAFSTLSVHPDVVDGIRALRAGGLRLATLTNGAREVAEGLLIRAGIRGEFDQLLSVEEAGAWKPARAAYAYACRMSEVAPDRAVLVAVHPWDIDGAARAGLRTAWLDRTGTHYPGYAVPPTWRASSLTELAEQLLR